MRGKIRKCLAAALTISLLLSCSACSYGRNGGNTLTIGIYAGSYWGAPTGDSYQVLDNAIARFEADHPGIKIEYVSGIGTDAYSEWLAQQILKGTEPDVYFVLPEDFNLLVDSGALENLDDLIANDPAFESAAYYDVCLRSGRFDGCQYALPYESVPTMMFVNKTLLEESGIALPSNAWTWDDFYNICAQVTDVEKHQYGVYDYTWIDAMYSNGAALFSENGKSCYLSDGKIQEAIRFVQRLEDLNGGYTVSSRDFDLGQVAFRPFLFSEYRAYQPYPWRVKKYSGFEWECVCMPAGPNGDNASELSTMLLGISSRSNNKDLAWEFVKLLSYNEDIQEELYISSHGISPLSKVAESPEILRQLSEHTTGSLVFSQEIVADIMNSAIIAPRFDRRDQALTMAQSVVSEAISSGEALQTRLLTAQREINIFLSRS